MPSEDDDVRLATIRESIEARLRPVCAHWPQALFDEMVRGLARITLKYEGEASASIYDRDATDRLVAELKVTMERNKAMRQSGTPPATARLPDRIS